jgi:hypothetical protein
VSPSSTNILHNSSSDSAIVAHRSKKQSKSHLTGELSNSNSDVVKISPRGNLNNENQEPNSNSNNLNTQPEIPPIPIKSLSSGEGIDE